MTDWLTIEEIDEPSPNGNAALSLNPLPPRQPLLGRRANKSLGLLTASALMQMHLPPVRYILEGYIAEGLTILAGRPKLGKSWLALDVGIAVAMGGYALNIRADQGDVLYLALEDNRRRIQKRLKQILQTRDSPSRLCIDLECPRLDQGGMEAIRDWVERVQNPRLVIIDVFNRVRPEPNPKESPYEADYRALGPLKALADEKGLAVLVVHHTRKMAADDALDAVAGSTGITGAGDTVLVLTRDSRGVTLYGRGRDIEEIETALSFDRPTCRWHVLGAASEVRRSDERQEILAALADADEPMSPKELMLATGAASRNAVDVLLFKMSKAGEIERVGRGSYWLPGKIEKGEQKEKMERFDESEAEGYASDQ